MVNMALFTSTPEHEINANLESKWRTYKSRMGALVGLFGLGIIIILAVVGLFLDESNLASNQVQLTPPSWNEAGSSTNLLGTDLAGRDIFTRLLKGAPLTLGISILSVSFALVVGTLLGLLAGFYRRYVQLLIMRTMDVIFAIPSLILAIIVVMMLGKGLFNAGLAVALVLIPNFVRTTMTHVIDEMQKPYVAAARLDGAHPIRILLSSVFPNIAAPLTLQTTIALSTAVIDIALLGFLGLGAQAPLPEWGVMLSEARTSMHIAPWAVTIPGLAILITVICINFIGDGLNRVINHKLRH